jgi:hypothetical protein
MEVLLIAVVAATNIACFVIGARVGQKVQKNEPIELPSIDPFKAHREREAQKKAQAEQERLEAILRNVEAYDGTSRGQKEVK